MPTGKKIEQAFIKLLAQNADENAIEEFLKKNKTQLDNPTPDRKTKRTTDWQTLLRHAVTYSNVAAVNILLANGADAKKFLVGRSEDLNLPSPVSAPAFDQHSIKLIWMLPFLETGTLQSDMAQIKILHTLQEKAASQVQQILTEFLQQREKPSRTALQHMNYLLSNFSGKLELKPLIELAAKKRNIEAVELLLYYGAPHDFKPRPPLQRQNAKRNLKREDAQASPILHNILDRQREHALTLNKEMDQLQKSSDMQEILKEAIGRLDIGFVRMALAKGASAEKYFVNHGKEAHISAQISKTKEGKSTVSPEKLSLADLRSRSDATNYLDAINIEKLLTDYQLKERLAEYEKKSTQEKSSLSNNAPEKQPQKANKQVQQNPTLPGDFSDIVTNKTNAGLNALKEMLTREEFTPAQKNRALNEAVKAKNPNAVFLLLQDGADRTTVPPAVVKELATNKHMKPIVEMLKGNMKAPQKDKHHTYTPPERGRTLYQRAWDWNKRYQKAPQRPVEQPNAGNRARPGKRNQ